MIKIFNENLKNVMETVKTFFCIEGDFIDEEHKIYFFPVLTYRIEISQEGNDIVIEISPSQAAHFLGDLIKIEESIKKSMAQIFCVIFGKKVELTIDSQLIEYTPDEEFRWIDKKTLFFEDKNCNMIKKFNKDFDYSSLPEKQTYKDLNKLVVDDKNKIIFSEADDTTKVKGYTLNEIIGDDIPR